MNGESAAYAHDPVMVAEIVQVFASVPPGVLVDATLGGAGHAAALLRALPEVVLVGIDRDDAALAASASALAAAGDRVRFVRARFDELAAVVAELGSPEVVGVLFDLGVSSPQLDDPGRGFSYRSDGPLDMRMDRRQRLTAATVVNTYDVDRLASVLDELGDERFARRIAEAIAAARPIETTTQLAELVRRAIPAATRRRGGHPATRTFQAIRIEVNEELAILADALRQAIDLLVPRGRLAVLAYHSGEDRIVKRELRRAESGGCTCPPSLPCACGARPMLRLLWRSGRTPSHAEVERNPRARAARLRAAERLDERLAA